MEMFWCKIFLTKEELVVAICDEELIGKEIGTKKLKIKVSRNFYGDRLADEKIVLKLMRRATICNLMGKEIVEIAKKNGFITEGNIILINGVPHAQFVKI
jgi:hypothetical protein